MRLIIGLWFVLCCTTLQAHTQSVSYATWHLDPQASVSFRIKHLELNRLGLHPAQNDFAEKSLQTIQNWFKLPENCQRSQSGSSSVEPGWIQVKIKWACVEAPTQISMVNLFDQIPYHTNLAAIYSNGHSALQTQFSAGHLDWTAKKSNMAIEFTNMFDFGFMHILTGWDHLMFLLALLLGTSKLSRLLILLTGFTIGHSVTLAAQVMGTVSPNSQMVEWVIALSILLIAIQNAWRLADYRGLWPYPLTAGILVLGWASGTLSLAVTIGLCLFSLCHLLWQKDSMAWLVTVALGLFHGFGFAGLLGQLELPGDQLVVPLMAFNLGIEAGQILLILIAAPILFWLRQSVAHTYSWLNAFAAATATFWLITRTF